MRRGNPLIFCLTARGLAWPRLETTSSSRISSITPAGRSSGGKGAGIDDPAAHDADGVHEGNPVGVFPGLVAADCAGDRAADVLARSDIRVWRLRPEGASDWNGILPERKGGSGPEPT